MKDCENNIINRLNFLTNCSNSSNFVGIGDDCAVIERDSNNLMVITTDTMSEDSHFIFSHISAEELAYKSIASNISDVISMGAEPKYLFMALTFSPKCSEKWLESFTTHFVEVCEEFGVTLLGGDTTHSPHALTITITAMGEVTKERLKLRSGAKIGDKICLLAPLAASAVGLKLLLESKKNDTNLTEQEQNLIKAHYTPKIFTKECLWLSNQSSVGAMMDISDGIAKDITHIAKKSGVGAEIELNLLPLEANSVDVCQKWGWEAETLALEGGEEYSPLFTIREAEFEAIAKLYKEQFSSEIIAIGNIAEEKEIKYYKNGIKVERNYYGYTHNNK